MKRILPLILLSILAAGAVAPLNGRTPDYLTLRVFVNSVSGAVSYADIRGSDGCRVVSTSPVPYAPPRCERSIVTHPMVKPPLPDGSVMGFAPIVPSGGASTLLGYAVVIISNSSLQSDLNAKEAELIKLEIELTLARNHLHQLEAFQAHAESVLAKQLINSYESDQPDLLTVVLELAQPCFTCGGEDVASATGVAFCSSATAWLNLPKGRRR